jgi:hypothetical protein
MHATDAVTFAGSALLLALRAVAAGFVPRWRASRRSLAAIPGRLNHCVIEVEICNRKQ